MLTATKTTVYAELESRVSHFIQRHIEDLTTHDREAIEKAPGVPFLHWTRECGTHIAHLFEADHECFPAKGERIPFLFGTADREHIARLPLDFAEYCRKESKTHLSVLYFDGKRLKDITCEKAVEIARDHYRKLLNSWSD
jgi:hypothetical protein